jgi:hypothetical protein
LLKRIERLIAIIIDLLKSLALLEYSVDILELVEKTHGGGINSSD